jgi:hypothetical protein
MRTLPHPLSSKSCFSPRYRSFNILYLCPGRFPDPILDEMYSRADEIVMRKGNAVMDLEVETRSYLAISLTFAVRSPRRVVSPG